MGLNKKSFSVDINEKLSEAFSSQVAERGYTKYRAIEGALRAFMSLPAEEQVRLMTLNLNVSQIEKSPTPVTLRDAVREIVHKTKEKQAGQAAQPGTIIHVSPSDKKFGANLQKLLGPEPDEKQGKKQKSG